MKSKSKYLFTPIFDNQVLSEMQARLAAKDDFADGFADAFDLGFNSGLMSDTWNMMAAVFSERAQKHFDDLEYANDTGKLQEFNNGNQAARIALKDEHAIVVTYINPSLHNKDMQNLIFVALKEVDFGGRPEDGYKAVCVCSVPAETIAKLYKMFGSYENLHAALAQTILSDKNWPSKLMRKMNPKFGHCLELGSKAFDIELSTVSAYVDNSEKTTEAFCEIWEKRGDDNAMRMRGDPDCPMIGSPADLEIAATALTQISEKLPRTISERAMESNRGPRP